MNPTALRPLLIFLTLTLVSGYFDSRGFLNAAQIWRGGNLTWPAIWRTNLYFLLGITAYWFSLRYLEPLGVDAPEIQAVIWFGVTLIGVAVASGRFFRWAPAEQLVALLVLAGLGWLFWRTGGGS